MWIWVALSACEVVAPSGGGWQVDAHPCVGHRTDTLWADDVDHLWVGCGSTTEGYGLFASTDGGATWSAPTTDPPGFFDDFRVSSVSRSDDGLLYVAGTGDGDRVVSLDGATVATVFASQSQTWNSFHVGTFRRADGGRAVAESLTGADLAWRPDDAAAFEDGYGWWTSGTSYQILDLDAHDGGFYGAGSTITQPPTVFLPADTDLAGFHLDPVVLDAGVSGELWSIDADAAGLIAGGVDQDRDAGLVYWTDTLDARDASDWSTLDLSTRFDDATWVRGVCRRGAELVAVGEHSRTGDGIVLCSRDGGATWTDETPTGAPPLHRCVVHAGGRVTVAGADGFVAVHPR